VATQYYHQSNSSEPLCHDHVADMTVTNATINSTLCSNCSTSPSPIPQALVGWVVEGPGRGTLNLISTCLVTIFLCTWVVIHPRVYQNELYATMHKFALFLKAILAPELIAVKDSRNGRSAEEWYTDGHRGSRSIHSTASASGFSGVDCNSGLGGARVSSSGRSSVVSGIEGHFWAGW
jgi:hypothetical protein